MLFSSITFLYYFLPIVLIIYHIVPDKWKNGTLLLASLVFYAWGEPKFIFLMIGMILIHYLSGILIGKFGKTKISKIILITTLFIGVGTLCFYKFSDTAWPIGISFYTFQLISYIIDVYRGTAETQKNIVNLGAYVTMFPQLIAGPIVRYIDIEKQLKNRVHSYEKTYEGIHRFVVGLGKKILISNALGELCEIFRSSDEKSVLFFWIYAISYTLQIYFDFSGYSDMAIGLGKIFGFDFLENFNYPYISKSITEFWRRWHISLGSWFRDYVYIPLGGNRVSKCRWYFNIFVVWALTGIWHGSALNFLIWGLMFGIILVFEKHYLLNKLEKAKIWNHFYVMIIVVISFVIFNAANIQEAFEYIKGMMGFGGVPVITDAAIYYLKSYAVLIVMAIIGSTPFVKNITNKMTNIKHGKLMINIFKPIILIFIMILCTAYLIDSSFNPFLYFRF